MDVVTRLIDLAHLHPRLLWDDISAAAAAVLSELEQPPFHFDLDVQHVPNFGSGQLRLAIDPVDISAHHIARIRRTYEPSRLVELTAVAIAGLGLYHAGGHEIRDVALRGSGADYMVDSANHLLEIAGRTRRSDFEAAWQQRWQRLSDRETGGFYVCVVEFETRAGKLEYRS